MKARVFVIGSQGMLGYAMHRTFVDAGYTVVGTCRGDQKELQQSFPDFNLLYRFDFLDQPKLEATINALKPEFIINCAAQKQARGENGDQQMLRVNGYAPRLLENIASRHDATLVHFSTDSVFDGCKAPHSETDFPRPIDAYSMSKYLGEVSLGQSLTLRTSMIGRSLRSPDGLVDWVLNHPAGDISGFSRAMFTGLPANIIADFVRDHVIEANERPNGILHLHSAQIDKATLLRLILDTWGRKDISVLDDTRLAPDRTLISSRLNTIAPNGFPSWPEMLKTMYNFYEHLLPCHFSAK